jgi:hypothetical protein
MARGSSRDRGMSDVMMPPSDVVTAHGTPPLNADNRTVFVGNLGQDIQVEVWYTEPAR